MHGPDDRVRHPQDIPAPGPEGGRPAVPRAHQEAHGLQQDRGKHRQDTLSVIIENVLFNLTIFL